MDNELTSEIQDGITLITLNRPSKRNALTAALIDKLHKKVSESLAAPNTKGIVLTGAAPAFCAGLDLNEVNQSRHQPDGPKQLNTALLNLLNTITDAPKPIVAAVNGAACAGGAALVTACDIAVAASSARIGYPAITKGMVAAVVMAPLVRAVGLSHAKYLLLTGKLIDSTEAQRIGLFHEVTPDNVCLERAIALATEAGSHPTDAYRNTKLLLKQTCPSQTIDPHNNPPIDHTTMLFSS